MPDETWRPLGVDSDEETVAHDALHDGVPVWLEPQFWRWVQDAVTGIGRYGDGSGQFQVLAVPLAEELAQTLQFPLQNLRGQGSTRDTGSRQLAAALSAFRRHPQPLQIADYLLAHASAGKPELLDALLARGKSAWTVGKRSGRPGLVRRVPIGVQAAADSVMFRTGRAGARLAKAWEELYGVTPDASASYSLAIKAVEDAAVPVVSPSNGSATLGTVLAQMEAQGDWQLPMDREHTRAPSREVLIGMMRMLWHGQHGQHDRHGGQPTAPGNVSIEEAMVAVSLAVTLVNLFHAGVVARKPS